MHLMISISFSCVCVCVCVYCFYICCLSQFSTDNSHLVSDEVSDQATKTTNYTVLKMLHKVALAVGSLHSLFRRHLFFSSFELSTNGVRICPVDLPEFIMFEKKMNLIVPVAIHGTPLSMFDSVM